VPGYAVKFQQVAVCDGAPLQIRSLFDRQQYADPLGEAAAAGISPACWPLFGQVWPSAQKLADLMQVRELAGLRILEIGCGLGLAWGIGLPRYDVVAARLPSGVGDLIRSERR